MNSFLKTSLLTSAVSAGFALSAKAAEIMVTADIATSTIWTADNTYNLQGQVYVLPGATLTIEAGTVVASDPGGSIAVTRGAQIFVNGEQSAPVIMTSTADVATWTGGDPSTGTWRESANEWGNLTIMGNAFISEDASPGNTSTPSASNFAVMEGLLGGLADTRNLYGGGNDDDDSGSINYLSVRYGGRVVQLNNELNGLSLGGLGRGTDIDYVEVMNNVDDGIEIWGGTANLKHVSIWNVGDDSFDIDQGWRGKAQFVLIVQGYSLDAPQGSGVGDNCFEHDGAEDSDYQPVTTATIYNATVIGQPLDGDGGTAWRDGARVQYRNSIFMDLGEQLVRPDGDDGDGANGYGFNGTLSFADVWTTPFSATSTVNPPANPGAFYPSQTSGNLAEITNSVMFRNLNGSAYTEATARGVFDAANNNVQEPGTQPIRFIGRDAPTTKGGKTLLFVNGLDPRPQADALTAGAAVPNDGFFSPANYRGAFDPEQNWLSGWTAADAFGFVVAPTAATNVITGSAGNVPSSFTPNGLPTLGNLSFGFTAANPTGNACAGTGLALAYFSFADAIALPFAGFGCGSSAGTLHLNPGQLAGFGPLLVPFTGAPVVLGAGIPNNAFLSGVEGVAQLVFADLTDVFPVAILGDAVEFTIGE